MSIPDPIEERQTPDKKFFAAATSTVQDVPVYKQHVFVSRDTPGVTVKLPNVGEAEGRTYLVLKSSAATGGTVTVNYTDGMGTTFTTAINTSGVEVLFRSMGSSWFVTR